MRLFISFGRSCSLFVIGVSVYFVAGTHCIIGISDGNQAIHTSSPRSNKYRQVSARLGLSNDVIASLPCLPNKRRTKNALFFICTTPTVIYTLPLPYTLPTPFVDSP